MKMKKLAALALSAAFALGALTACGGSSSSGSVPAAASASGSVSVSGASLKEVNIGLIQLMEHASLDEIRTAIEAGLEAKGAEYGVKVNVDYQNAQGISYTEASVASTGDVQTAAQTLLSKCDAIFAPIDNTVASAMGVLADEAIKAGKPVYVAADSMVNDGGLATVGVNYTNLGTQTADMLLKVLTGTPVCEVPVEVLKENAVVVNEETAAAIGVDVSKYAR